MGPDRYLLPQLARLSGMTASRGEAGLLAYRYLARAIDREFPRAALGTVLALSCPDDQLSTNILLLQAYALQAELESSVLIIDARVAGAAGGLTQRLGMEKARGYADVLEHGPVEIDALIQPSAVPGVSVLPIGGPVTAGMRSMQDHLAQLLAWARKRYGHVLLQVGSVLADTRTLVTAVHADAVLLLVHEHGTTMAALDEAQNVLRTNGASNVRALLVTAQP